MLLLPLFFALTGLRTEIGLLGDLQSHTCASRRGAGGQRRPGSAGDPRDGSYGPSLVLFSLLGMEPRAAFPIMMGSGAFVGLVAAMRFVSSGRYVAPAVVGLTLGGVPAVLMAVWLVWSLPLDIVRWGVIVVVLYTAVTLIRSAAEERRTVAAARAAALAGA